MSKEKLSGLKSGLALVALLILSACSSAVELEDGDFSSGDEAVASADGSESAPVDAVPAEGAPAEGTSTAAAQESGAPTEGNPELELAAAANQNAESKAQNGAASSAPPAEVLPPVDVATDSAPPAPVAANELPPPAEVSVTPPAPAPVEQAAVPAAEAPVQAQAQDPIAQVENRVPASPEAPAVPAPEVAGGDGVSYTVQKGDTLMKISWEQYGDLFRWREIYALNKAKIADPNHVPPGTVLQIAGQGRSPASAMEHTGEQYLIMNGDTLGKISGKVYGSKDKWKMIWENNKRLIRDPNKIYAGFYLYYVPESKMTAVEREDSAEES